MNKLLKNRWLSSAALLILGLLLGWIIKPSSSEVGVQASHDHTGPSETWTCSMHPQIRQDEPGSCPICGMDLIPLSNTGEAVAIDEVQMTESAMKLAAVQTVTVSNDRPQKSVQLPGKVEADERRIAKVTAHFGGRVERLFADFTGQYISAGQRLATIYSPDLVTAQKELFEALKFKTSNPSFYDAAVQKLKLWELTDQQIQQIVDKGEPQYYFDVYAPRSGTIIARNISEGEHVKEGTVLVEIANLNRLWVLFDAYESDLQWIAVGDSVQFRVQSIPATTFQSVITFIDPIVNKETRTASIRTEIQNPNGLLKPEMFVEGALKASLPNADNQLLVPKSAVLWTGKRAVVYVLRPNYAQPTFQFREVKLGPDAGDHYVVEEGLEAGEEVAANGVFKIDAAAQLEGKVSMMNPNGGKVATGHDHGSETDDSSTPTISHPEVNIAVDTFEVSSVFREQLRSVFESYLPVKDALVETDAGDAQGQAIKLLAAIEEVDMALLKGEAHMEWMKDLAVLKAVTEIMTSSSDVEEIRAALSPLSDQLFQTIVKFDVATGGFRQYCPMAFDFEGAFWLSDSDEILNPYFGDQMLTCGNVEEELN